MTARKSPLDPLVVSLLLGWGLLWRLLQLRIKAMLAEIPPMFPASRRLAGGFILRCVCESFRPFT